MSTISGANRGRLRARQQARQARGRMLKIAAVLGALLVAAAAIGLLWPGLAAGTSVGTINYGPQDVARGQPVVAVHEMEPGPSIPFLPASGPQPSIVVNTDFINVGSVDPNEIVRLPFIIANTGEAPLTISRAYTTCGCTTAEISSVFIPPGQVAEVTLIFDAGFHDTRGQTVRRGLIIENNDPRHSVSEIWLQAAVRSN